MKEAPDRNDYQVWLIDYLDGTLDSTREAALFAFLEKNPDLKEELEDIRSLPHPGNMAEFRGKDLLKKNTSNIPAGQFEILCIADAENDLDDAGRGELLEIISPDPGRRKIYEEIAKIKLKAPAITFRGKSRLKKLTTGGKIVRYSIALLSAAAAVTLILLSVNTSGTAERHRGELSMATNQGNNALTVENIRPRVTAPSIVKPKDEVKVAVKVRKAVTGSVSALPPVINVDTSGPGCARIEISAVSFRQFTYEAQIPDIQLASMNLPAVINDYDPEEDRGPGRAFIRFFREKILKSPDKSKMTIDAFEIADAGVTLLNKAFGWDMSLKKNTAGKGETQSVQFKSGLLKFSTPVKKSSASE
ncbi:MAG TPA: hypothetical protein VMT63_08760 [Bacteroidales bacterium]|nr:hypothetical protein [Bacteroidales bacterium]